MPFAELAWLVEPTPEEQDWLDERGGALHRAHHRTHPTRLRRRGLPRLAADPLRRPRARHAGLVRGRRPRAGARRRRAAHAPRGPARPAHRREAHRAAPDAAHRRGLDGAGRGVGAGARRPRRDRRAPPGAAVGRLRVDAQRRPTRPHPHRPGAGAVGGQGRRHGRHRHRRARGPRGADADAGAVRPRARRRHRAGRRWWACSTSRPARHARSSPRCSRDPGTRALRPLLVTGSTVAGAHATLAALREQVRLTDPETAETLRIVPLERRIRVGAAPPPGRRPGQARTRRGPPGGRRRLPPRGSLVLASVGRARHATPHRRRHPGPGRHPRPARRGLGRPLHHRSGRPHHRHLPDGRGADPRPRPAHRPGVARTRWRSPGR